MPYASRSCDSPAPAGRAASVNFRYLSTLIAGYPAGSDARNSAGEAAASCAAARSGVQPGFSRPNTLSHHVVPAFARPLPSVLKAGSEQSGRATSKTRPTSSPWNPAGATPTISTGRPFSVIVRPTADGSLL